MRNGLYVMKKIVTTTIDPGQRADLADPLSETASNSSLSVSPAFRSRSASSFALRTWGWKKPCWRPKRTMIARKPTLTKASLVVPGRPSASR